MSGCLTRFTSTGLEPSARGARALCCEGRPAALTSWLGRPAALTSWLKLLVAFAFAPMSEELVDQAVPGARSLFHCSDEKQRTAAVVPLMMPSVGLPSDGRRSMEEEEGSVATDCSASCSLGAKSGRK